MNAAPSALLTRLRNGDQRALARVLSVLERDATRAHDLLRALRPLPGKTLVVGFTGPPGAGKSTLISTLIRELRLRNRTVAVIAVDPSSPVSGGSVLGDRFRMSEHSGDPGVFVRSVASRGHLGGLNAAAVRMIDAFDAAGRDVVILETVGAGQSETEIAAVADLTVLVCAPGAGDEVQTLKAGILEIADILVVNKADLPQAESTVTQLTTMLAMRVEGTAKVPVMRTVATHGTGVAALTDSVLELAATLSRTPVERRSRRTGTLLAQCIADLVRGRITDGSDPTATQLCEAIQQGIMDPEQAAQHWISALDQARDQADL